MADSQFRGKSVTAVARDVAGGFFTINPLVLKKVDPEGVKTLHAQLKKVQIEVRGEKIPVNDPLGLRNRNARLQRLHNALIVLEHTAKERKVAL